jgi:hypothetical protein
MGWYRWVKRADRRVKDEMGVLVAVAEEMDLEQWETLGVRSIYRLERGGGCWMLMAEVVQVHRLSAWAEVGDVSGESIVECLGCREIFTLAEEDECPYCSHGRES